MIGQVDILSVGAGHLELKFDKDNPIELERARRAVVQLLRSGCILFVEVDGKLERVLSFNEANDTYIVADVPNGESGDVKAEVVQEEANKTGVASSQKTKGAVKASNRRARKAVDATGAKATAVPMRSGG